MNSIHGQMINYSFDLRFSFLLSTFHDIQVLDTKFKNLIESRTM